MSDPLDLKTGRPSLTSEEARGRALELRKSLSRQEIARLSEETVTRFLKAAPQGGFDPDRCAGLRIALYQALPSELDLNPLARTLEERGAKLCFPRIVSSEAREIEFVEMREDQAIWQTGLYGIDEPHHELPAVLPSSLNLIFVPGSAFSLDCARVGMGRGYYDRFLARIPGVMRIALVFDFQIFHRIDVHAWDEPIDWLISEKREIRRPRVLRAYLQTE